MTTRASAAERRRGELFTWSVHFAFFLVGLLRWLVLGMGILVTTRVGLLFVLASHHTRLTRRAERVVDFPPTVSVVVPACNEEVGIERAIRSLADSDYPQLEFLVVDDGSTDRTAEIVARSGSTGSASSARTTAARRRR